MSTNCIIKIGNERLDEKLTGFTGKNESIKQTMYCLAINNNGYTAGFKKYFKDNYKEKLEIVTDKMSDSALSTIASAIRDYYYSERPRVQDSIRTTNVEDIISEFGYTTSAARDLGLNLSADAILANYMVDETDIEDTKKFLDRYLGKLKRYWLNNIINIIAQRSGKTTTEIREAYNLATDKCEYIDNELGGKNKDITNANYFAIYKELFSSKDTALRYVRDVAGKEKVSAIYAKIKSELDELFTKDANDTNSVEGSSAEDDVFDVFISDVTNHFGTYTSFMAHVGDRIRNYFNTLKVLRSANVQDYDTDNVYGIPTTMDSNACCSMLYNQGTFNNIDQMIATIDRIGKTFKGYEAFVQVAQDLQNDKDLAAEMLTVFAKTKLSRLEYRIVNGKSVLVASNRTAFSDKVFAFNLQDDVKGNIEIYKQHILTERLNAISEQLRSVENDLYKASDSRRRGNEEREKIAIENLNIVKRHIISLIKDIFPSIEDAAVSAFIDLYNNATTNKDKCKNINLLISSFRSVINEVANCQQAYNNMLLRKNNIKLYNKLLREKAVAENRFVDYADYKPVRDAFTDDYIARMKNSIENIVKLLLPYSVIDTNLNSRNVHGNNNSDIINNSLITRLIKMLDNSRVELITDENGNNVEVIRNEQLERWGKSRLGSKAKTKQFSFSNFLLEDNELGTKGLFKYVCGELCVTPYATEILQLHLFNGSSNLDSSKNASYSEMGMGDFLPTSFSSYFRTNESHLNGIKLGTFFLRTPSDASKTFMIQAPKYSTNGLIAPKNITKFKNDVKSIIAKAYQFRGTEDNKYAYLAKSSKLHISEAISMPHRKIVDEYSSIQKIAGTERENGSYEALVSFKTSSDDVLVYRGTVVREGKADFLYDGKLQFLVGEEYSEALNAALTDYFTELHKKEDITVGDTTWLKAEMEINKNHPVFKMLKKRFRQEMVDAASALNHYFELEEDNKRKGTYWVKTKDLSPIFRDGKSANRGYVFYHLGEDGKVISPIGKGKVRGYTLGGKVFHSNSFTLSYVDKESNELIHRNFLDELIISDTTGDKEGKINFLYGRAMAIVASVNENGERIVDDVIFSEDQENAIDAAISDYLDHYIEQASNEISKRSDFIEDEFLDLDHIVDYSVNNLLMHYEYDHLFEGSTKFYKDGQTILKRAKESQGSGVPYGIVNYSADDEYSTQDLTSQQETTFLNDGFVEEDVLDENGKKVRNEDGTVKTRKVSIQEILNQSESLKGTKSRRAFRAVTIANTKMTNEVALTTLFNKLVEQGLDEEFAKDILYGAVEKDEKGRVIIDKNTGNPLRKKGFTNTKVNDAQSYITVQEWVRRIAARGQLQRYLPLIRKLIACEKDPNVKLTANELKEFVQVQKNFYYDLYYDERYDLYVPRQIKNAEFVLVPQLIEGTELHEVYNLMKKHGIDQLNTIETSKASNETVLTLWDNTGVITEENKKSFDNTVDEFIQPYSYNYLYTQQETSHHVNDKNKAAIQFMKKILDNIPSTGKLAKLKEEFFRIYCANIKQSADDTLRDFDIPMDSDGNLVIDEDCRLSGLNIGMFLNKLRDELIRTGIDSNLADYVTLKENAVEPIMPAEIMNNVMTKFESVVQSVFNNKITRQKLPGSHAAQVTNVGWSPLSNKVTDVSYAQNLRYHPDGKPYIEIIVPYSFLGIDKNSAHYRNMNDEKILEELADSKLDTIIGYRIPTEGKQSICNMKIVGFVSDAFGSTIIVPNDWVSQTGSDFDFDSIYTVNPEMYKDLDGKINKVEYKTELTKRDWVDFVLRKGRESIDAQSNKDKKLVNKRDNERVQDDYERFQEKQDDYFSKLSDDVKKFKKALDEKINVEIKRKGLSKIDAFIYRLERTSDVLCTEKNRKASKTINDYYKYLNSFSNYLKGQASDLEMYKDEELDNLIEKYDLHNQAETLGIMPLEDFLNPENVEIANDTRARNTRLFEIALSILEDDTMLEENLSRSNFDHLVDSRNSIMSSEVKLERNNRSPYNVFDQMKYQEDAMSGAKLKAASVVLDTFCSVCNTVKPTLTNPVRIIYSTDDFNDNNLKSIKNRFNEVDYKDGETTISIMHDTYGWTRDNRSVSGNILTSYSSETTAYILDAIKEGSIPNINDYTFPIYKTLLNIGSNYNAANAFIMQPVVAEIVNEYNKTNSVFASRRNNPIEAVIRRIAKDLDVDASENRTVNEIVRELNDRYKKDFNKIYGQGGKDITISLNNRHLRNLPLIVPKLIERIKGKGSYTKNSPVKRKALFDLGVILMFNKLNAIAREAGNVARCCNPDKFGAKQTVFATKKVLRDMDDLIFKKEYHSADDEYESVEEEINARRPLLEVNGEHILSSIYPGLNDRDVHDVDGMIRNLVTQNRAEESTYPSLYSFLKYASATSVVVSRSIFNTQSKGFTNLIEGIESTFTGYKTKLDEDTYNDFVKYVIASAYKEARAIKHKVLVRKVNGEVKIELEKTNDANATAKSVEETYRIHGYERRAAVGYIEEVKDDDGNVFNRFVEFDVKDINNPTNSEMEKFELLSPAQKITFIRQRFSDSGIFAYIKPNLFNSNIKGNLTGMQSLEYIEQNIGNDVAFNLFKQAFYNNNPLIVSATIDVVKYAAQVEGFRMSAKAINKVIDNDCLYNELGDNGLGFVDDVKRTVGEIGAGRSKYNDSREVDILYENYLRSHPETKGIRTLYLSVKNEKQGKIMKLDKGMLYLRQDVSSNIDEETRQNEFNRRLSILGIKTKLGGRDYKTNKYIRIGKKDTNMLYKINDFGSYVILYPLGNLRTNENSQWSLYEDYNTGIYSKQVYESIMTDYLESANKAALNSNFIKAKIQEYKEKGMEVSYDKRANFNKQLEAAPFNLQELAENDEGSGLHQILVEILRHFREPGAEDLYLYKSALSDFIFTPGPEFGSTQKIVDAEGNERYFHIYIPTDIENLKNKYLKPYDGYHYRSTEKIENHTLKAIIDNAQNKYKTLKSLVRVQEVNLDEVSGTRQAAFGELENLGSTIIESVNSKGISQEEDIELKRQLAKKGITVETKVIHDNLLDTTRAIARHAKLTAERLNRDYYEHFVEDPDNSGDFIAMNDPRTLDIIKKNDLYLNKYIEFLNEVRKFIDQHEGYLNAKSEDDDIQFYIDDIKKSLKLVSEFPVNELAHNLNRAYAEEYSTNPLIKDRLIDVMDGYWKTYGDMWVFNDVMENGTPILQIILKDVMSRIDARQKHFEHVVRKGYRAEVKRLFDEAKANGKTIDLKKIFKGGRIIRPFTEQFVEDLNEAESNLSQAALEKGMGSKEYIRAFIKLETLKTAKLHREAKPEYYLRRLQIYIDAYRQIPDLLSDYLKLYYEKMERQAEVNEGTENPNVTIRIAEINDEMINLTNISNYTDSDGNVIPRPNDGSPYSRQSVAALKTFINNLSTLNREHFEYEEEYGFREKLEKELRIIKLAERRDDRGVPTADPLELQNNEEYKRAKAWVASNAYFTPVANYDSNGNPTGVFAKIKKAFDYFSLVGSGKDRTASKIAREHDNGKGIRDANGVPDARKLTRSEIAKIKEAHLKKWSYGRPAMFSDRTLISNASREDRNIYKAEFYNKLKLEGVENNAYFEQISKINRMLEKCLNNGVVDFSSLPDDDTEIVVYSNPEHNTVLFRGTSVQFLNTLADFYLQLQNMRKVPNPTNAEEVHKFIEDEVEFTTNTTLFSMQRTAIETKSREFKEAWYRVCCKQNKHGYPIILARGVLVPNSFLYGSVKPKEEGKYIDLELQEAVETIQKYCIKTPTPYYYEAMYEHMQDPNDFQEWFNDNHYYNPITHKMEPLDCWVFNGYNKEAFADGSVEAKWMPSNHNRNRKVKNGIVSEVIDGRVMTAYDPETDKRNPYFKDDRGKLANYRVSTPADSVYDKYKHYDTHYEVNEYEEKFIKFIEDLLLSTTSNSDTARRFFEYGFLPRRMKKKKTTPGSIGMEIGKLLGLNISTENGNKPWDENIDYSIDKTPIMPMHELLNNKNTIDLEKKIKQLREDESKLSIDSYGGDETLFNKAKEELQNQIKEETEKLRKERNDLLDEDWISVFEDYLERASRFNVVQENKQKLYHLLNTLRNLKMYTRKYGAYGDLKVDRKKSAKGDIYEESVDDKLIKQYETLLHRVLFDQWKMEEGKLTSLGNALQGFTSANYMMLNIRGGIANVTLGETAILAEAAAKEFFDKKDWWFGTKEYMNGIIGYARSAFTASTHNKLVAYNKQGAIINFFNVVDFEEANGVVREISLEDYSKKFRDMQYSPNSAGEHFMQNSVLFAMLRSHKLFTDELGRTVYMTKREYKDARLAQEIKDVFNSPEEYQKFLDFKEELKQDKNKIKDYAWFRKNTLTNYIYLHCSDEQIQKFIKIKNEKYKQFEEEFDKKQSLYDQLELGADGTMSFIPGTELAELDKIPCNDVINLKEHGASSEVKSLFKMSQAIYILGKFAEKTRKVNNKIHGAYYRLGAAHIERRWYGGLVTQYHKHLPIGLLKRYASRGHWNEFRDSVDKGMIHSITDVLRLNYEKIKHDAGMTDEQLGALQGFMFLLTHSVDYLKQLRTTLEVVPSYERANILRNAGDAIGVVSALLTTAALWFIADDDDELQENLFFNVALYEADRLASEAFLYNPMGMFNETKKLMSTPVAAQSVISDAISSALAIMNWMFDDEFDPYYKSGRFAGEPKILVYIQRRIPMWNGIRGLLDTPSNNHYYKLGANPIGLINIKKLVTDEK